MRELAETGNCGNPLTDPNRGDFASELHYHGEHAYNMNGGSKYSMGDAERARHKTIVESKVIKHTALTERREEHTERMDVTKNFSRLPKIYNDPQPNDAGEPVYHRLFKKDAKAGMAKGGIRYGKGK